MALRVNPFAPVNLWGFIDDIYFINKLVGMYLSYAVYYCYTIIFTAMLNFITGEIICSTFPKAMS